MGCGASKDKRPEDMVKGSISSPKTINAPKKEKAISSQGGKGGARSSSNYIDQTESQAIARHALFKPNSEINYDLAIQMPKNQDNFKGVVTITFTLSSISDDFFIDFDSEKSIDSFTLNGSSVSSDSEDYRKGNQLYPPTDLLKSGQNTITISYSGKYNNDVGFVSHQIGDSQYIYSTLQPYQAHYLAPTFDQPDLKAQFSITLITHNSWKAISSERCISSESSLKPSLASFFELSGDEVVHEFAKTKPLSTYMIQVAAGDWDQIDCNQKHKNVDFRIFFRPEFREQAEVAAPNVFNALLIGFKFFEEFTGTEYPFGKYDTIFAPENSAEALESTGAVSFDEKFLECLNQASEEYCGYVDLTLHELAHQWFGNLVTLKWWGDLWLNEGFTVFVSRLATFKHEFEGITPDDKAGNYLDPLEKLMTRELKGDSHCLSCRVADTKEGAEVFDEIMYEKGSYAVTQLYFNMGEANFKKALKSYFDAFKFKNVTAADMVSIFSKFSSPYDMKDFETDWIHGEGVSQLQVEWNSTSDGHIIIKQHQTVPEHNSCKKMKVKVGFFDWTGAALEMRDIVLEREETKVTYDSSKLSPQIVYPNCERMGYAKISLDEISNYFYHKYASQIENPTTKIDVHQAADPKKYKERVENVSEGDLDGLVERLRETHDNLEFDALASGALKAVESCSDDEKKANLFQGLVELAVELGAKQRFKRFMILQLMCQAVASDDQTEVLENLAKGKGPGGWSLGEQENNIVNETLKIIRNG